MEKVVSAKNIESLTGLRGVAAIYVVIFHYWGSSYQSRSEQHSSVIPGKMFLAHGYLSVDLFFILSGFVMTLNYQHMFERGFEISAYFKFLGRRLARVYPIYAVCTIAAFLILVLNLEPNIRADVSSNAVWGLKLLANLLMIQNWGIASDLDIPAWSLSVEWAAYMLFPVLLIPSLFRSARLALAFGLICVALLFVAYFLSDSPLRQAVQNQYLNADIRSDKRYHDALAFLRCLPEFVLGISAFRVSSTAFGRGLRSSSWMSSAIAFGLMILLALPRTELVIVLLFPLLVVSVSSGAIHLPGRILSSALARVAGRLSYSIYLIHTLLIGVLDFIQRKVSALGVAHGHFYASVLSMALTTILAYLSYTYIEVPGRRWLRYLFEEKK